MLNFVLYASSSPGQGALHASDPSMLGAAVRCFPANQLPFKMVMEILRRLDAQSAREVLAATDPTGSTALMDACRLEQHSEAVLDELLALPGGLATVNASDLQGCTALIFAAQHDAVGSMQRLMRSGSSLT